VVSSQMTVANRIDRIQDSLHESGPTERTGKSRASITRSLDHEHGGLLAAGIPIVDPVGVGGEYAKIDGVSP